MAELEGTYEPGAWDWVNDQVAAYERSGGKEAGTLQGTDMAVIVVTTRGAKTAKVRKFALMRVEHDGRYALVASKGGMPHDPAWVNNLEVYPDEVLIQDGPDRFPVQVARVEGPERDQWWARAVAAYPDYETYKANTERHIPVFVATRR